MVTNSELPRITIVTPSYNLASFLEDTIKSVVLQGYPNLEYIIIDGGSTDGSVDIIKKYDKYITYWVSEKDQGIYDALNKGFYKSTGQIMGWLNADDILHPKSLFTISDIFLHNDKVYWIQGMPSLVDEIGRTISTRKPSICKYSLLNKEYWFNRNCLIQQESTFWRKSLWNKAGGSLSKDYNYAGDFELWMRFFSHEKLYSTHALIGAFRSRKRGQLSKLFFNEYLSEADRIVNLYLEKAKSSEKKNLLLYRLYKSKIIQLPILNRLFYFFNPCKSCDELIVKYDYARQSFFNVHK